MPVTREAEAQRLITGAVFILRSPFKSSTRIGPVSLAISSSTSWRTQSSSPARNQAMSFLEQSQSALSFFPNYLAPLKLPIQLLVLHVHLVLG